MSDPQTVYHKYVEEFGYGPKHSNHLMAFAKRIGVSINYGAAQKLIAANASSNSSKPVAKNIITKSKPPQQIPVNIKDDNKTVDNPPNTDNNKATDNSNDKPAPYASDDTPDDNKTDDNKPVNILEQKYEEKTKNNNNYERIKITKSNINDIKSKISNECGININNIDINIGDEILKTQNRYAICKSQYINELNSDLSKYGHPSNTLSEKFTVLVVFGTDDRVRVDPTTIIPYAGICYLTYRKDTIDQRILGRGTGWLLNNSNQNSDYQLIITSGHCVYSELQKSFVTNMTIYPANNSPSLPPYGTIAPLMFFSNTKYINNIDIDTIKAKQYDYGAILIRKSDNKSIYNFTIYENDIPPYTTFKSCTLAGYPGHVNNKDVKGEMYKDNGDLTVYNILCLHRIDSSEGQSGSPIWKVVDPDTSEIRVISIHNSGLPTDKTNYGVNAVYVKPYFDRWLAPQASSKQINGPITDTFTLQKDKSWTLNTTYISAPNNMVVIGVSLIKDGGNSNHIGLKLICANLNGTGYTAVRTDDDVLSTQSISSGHDRYFVTQMLNAPTDSSKGGLSRMIGGNLFWMKKDSKHYQIRINLNVKYPNGDTQAIQSPSDASDGNVGKNEDAHMSSDEIVSAINYTAVTGLAFGVTGRTASINMITNVFWG